jgi:hypothetical protein
VLRDCLTLASRRCVESSCILFKVRQVTACCIIILSRAQCLSSRGCYASVLILSPPTRSARQGGPRTPSLKQLSCNLSLLTLDLWLYSYVAVWLCSAFAKRSRTPETRLGLGAGLGLKAPSVWLASTNTPSIETAASVRYSYCLTSRRSGIDNYS